MTGRRGFLGSLVAAAFAPAAVLAAPAAAPVVVFKHAANVGKSLPVSSLRMGRGQCTMIFHVDESPFQENFLLTGKKPFRMVVKSDGSTEPFSASKIDRWAGWANES